MDNTEFTHRARKRIKEVKRKARPGKITTSYNRIFKVHCNVAVNFVLKYYFFVRTEH